VRIAADGEPIPQLVTFPGTEPDPHRHRGMVRRRRPVVHDAHGSASEVDAVE
jgi:hypothetical protein